MTDREYLLLLCALVAGAFSASADWHRAWDHSIFLAAGLFSAWVGERMRG